MLKMAAFAPIPSASVSAATAANPGFFNSPRTPYRTSCQRVPIETPPRRFLALGRKFMAARYHPQVHAANGLISNLKLVMTVAVPACGMPCRFTGHQEGCFEHAPSPVNVAVSRATKLCNPGGDE